MNEIWTTVVGNIAGNITKRRLTDGTELASFRVASNERRLDKTSGTWLTSGTSYVSVTAWRRLGLNVMATFVKGDPVVVYGRLSTREYEDKEGNLRTDVGIDAQSVGPDLSWCTAALTRSSARSNTLGTERASDAAQSDAAADSGFEGGELLPGARDEGSEEVSAMNGHLVSAVPGDGG